MNRSSAFFSVILLCVFLIASVIHAELIAPVYPGSKPAEHEVSEIMKPYLKAFYSRDPIEKVAEFYRQNTGEMKEVRKGQEYENLFRRVRVEKAAIQPSPIGIRIITKRPTDMQAAKATHKYGGITFSPCRGHEFFRHLESLKAILPGKSTDDFNAACERFFDLTWAYFIMTDKTDQRQRPLNKAQAMITEFVEKEAGMNQQMDEDAFARKMEKLISQGNMAEVQRLSQQYYQGISAVLEPDESRWDNYINLLQKIEKHAFQTLIYIHREPPGK